MKQTSLVLLTAAIIFAAGVSSVLHAAAPTVDLQTAAATGNVGAIRDHVAAGSDLNQKEPAGGSTPLMTAAVFGQTEAVRALIKGGADLNLQNNDGSTALISAAFLGRTEIVKTLLAARASTEISNNVGATALQAAEVPFEAAKGIYDVIGQALGPLGLKLDYEQIKAERPRIAELLRAASSKSKDTPSASGSRTVAGTTTSTTIPAVTAEDWSTYNYSVNGWRFNSAEKTLSPANVGELTEKWRFPTDDSKEKIGVVHATPAVVAGEVYFGTATYPAFYKLSADGKLLWTYRNPEVQAMKPPAQRVTDTKLGAAAGQAGIFSSALVADGAVYFADAGGWIYSLDAATGAERWKINTRAPGFPDTHWMNLSMSSPIKAGDRIIFAGGTLEQLIGGSPGYPGCTGRGWILALDPQDGAILWKYNVGPKPQKLDPPVVMEGSWGKYKYESGPATSSVWCTPSYDPESNTLFFGTDVNTAPRQPTPDNPALYTDDSDAIVALDAATGKRRWNTQINQDDVWTNSQRAYDPKTGRYKDQSIGDTPKIFTIDVDGKPTKVVGAGCKNGGFYILRADSGRPIRHTPVYSGPPSEPPAPHDRRVLALPSPIGGLQTGCATDGHTIFSNGIDAIRLGTLDRQDAAGQLPTGGRVTATSVDLKTELWRHERPKIPAIGGTVDQPMYRNVGDIVGSGVAVGNGVVYFTTVGSEKLVALDAATGAVLKEITIGPVFSGPSLSRGHVYVGGGNTLFTPIPEEAFFPKQYTGSVRCFGLP